MSTPESGQVSLETINIDTSNSLQFPVELLRERPILRQHLLELFTDLLVTNRYQSRPIPRPLLESNREPLSDPAYLADALIPPNVWRTGTLTDRTKTDIANRSEKALTQQEPLQFR